MGDAVTWVGAHWLDIVLVVVLLIFFFMGWKMGLIKGAFSLIGLVGGIWFAGLWGGGLATWIEGNEWLSGDVAFYVSHLVIILITLLIAYIVAHYVGKVTKFGFLSSVNTIGGMVVGLLIGAFLAQAVIIAIANVNVSFVQNGIENSSIAGVIRPVTGWAVNILPDKPDFLKGVKDFLNPGA